MWPGTKHKKNKVYVDSIVISNIIEAKHICWYLTGYLDEVIRPLVLILPKMSGYVKTYEEKNNKFMSLHIDDEKLSEKYKTI